MWSVISQFLHLGTIFKRKEKHAGQAFWGCELDPSRRCRSWWLLLRPDGTARLEVAGWRTQFWTCVYHLHVCSHMCSFLWLRLAHLSHGHLPLPFSSGHWYSKGLWSHYCCKYQLLNLMFPSWKTELPPSSPWRCNSRARHPDLIITTLQVEVAKGQMLGYWNYKLCHLWFFIIPNVFTSKCLNLTL